APGRPPAPPRAPPLRTPAPPPTPPAAPPRRTTPPTQLAAPPPWLPDQQADHGGGRSSRSGRPRDGRPGTATRHCRPAPGHGGGRGRWRCPGLPPGGARRGGDRGGRCWFCRTRVGGCVPMDDLDERETAMIGRLGAVVVDCQDPHALARFYSELLGLPITEDNDEWIDIGDGDGMTLSFQRAPDHQPPRWPDPMFPQQFHLDIMVTDIDAAEPKVLDLGATLLSKSAATFRVYADPAGHPFCL